MSAKKSSKDAAASAAPEDRKATAKDGADEKAAYVARQLDQEKIVVLTDRVEKLLKSNTILRNGASQNEKNAHDVELYYRREMEVKDDIIVRLNEELVKRDSQLKSEIDKMKRKFDADLNDLRSGTESIIVDLRMRLQASEKDLVALEAYRKDRDLHDERQRLLERMLQEKDQRMAEALEEQERKFFEEKAHIFKDLDKRKDVLREIALKEAREAMGTEAKKIVADNDRMFEVRMCGWMLADLVRTHRRLCHAPQELKFLHSSTADLEAEKLSTQQQLVEARREISILVEKELEYAKQAHHKSREIADLRSRVEMLEKQHAVNLEKFRQHAQDLRGSVSQDLEAAAVDAAGLRRLLKLKNHELRQMKALASTILDQRSETEEFFMEALNEVKEAIRVERRQRQRAIELGHAGPDPVLSRSASFAPGDVGGDGRHGQGRGVRRSGASTGRPSKVPSTGMLKLPALSIKPDHALTLEKREPQRLATPDHEKVHIRDLSWTDKELVLRVLFAKLNQSKRRTDKKEQRQQKLMELAALPAQGAGDDYPFFVSEGAGGDYVPEYILGGVGDVGDVGDEAPGHDGDDVMPAFQGAFDDEVV